MSRIFFKNICEEKNQLGCPPSFLFPVKDKGEDSGNENY